MIHGAIDGYSRLIVFMSCSNNKKASTVFSQFLKAVNDIDCPQESELIKEVGTLM